MLDLIARVVDEQYDLPAEVRTALLDLIPHLDVTQLLKHTVYGILSDELLCPGPREWGGWRDHREQYVFGDEYEQPTISVDTEQGRLRCAS
jgi:hypothetical protein